MAEMILPSDALMIARPAPLRLEMSMPPTETNWLYAKMPGVVRLAW